MTYLFRILGTLAVLLAAGALVACSTGNIQRSTPVPSPTTLAIVAPEATPTANWEKAPFTLQLEPIATHVKHPVALISSADGTNRLFILQKKGTIRILQDNKLLEKPFLDLNGHVSIQDEQALQGMTFAPDFQSSRFFYISYNRKEDKALVLARYHVSENPNIADPTSATDILVIPHPETSHNGGQIAFGPDGNLYFAVGDGGAQTSGKFAQSLDSLFGKLLRIDVSTLPYRIPPDNPFVSQANARPEIWASGLRNPWRFTFDSANGNLYLVDVGDTAYEEIDFQSASSAGGENYGWRVMEGVHCHTPVAECHSDGLVLPIFEYPHVYGCAIVGGVLYHGKAIPQLEGSFVFGDFCFGRIWSLVRSEAGDVRVLDLANLNKRISAIAADESGNLYIADYDENTIYRLIVDD